ncbi:ATP-binding protein [Streptomyces sp. RKAG293]|uniref:ATP-binding protein n=1 Tax=Streptomyces sp. RKAG293 TaxID=2893403 RepID=UPI0020335A87|nr:ATP-binding protein [Streptomyces sp. RKAG293]MCM2416584.1 ATP-binding protein [Streptomyces sp. RKAG293]
MTLAPGLAAPSAARRAVRALLTGHAWEQERIDEAVLVVSELVTNAVVHALPPYNLLLRLNPGADGGLSVHVTDGGTDPHPAHWAADRAPDEHGHGTTIITALSNRTGITTDPNPGDDADAASLIDSWADFDGG